MGDERGGPARRPESVSGSPRRRRGRRIVGLLLLGLAGALLLGGGLGLLLGWNDRHDVTPRAAAGPPPVAEALREPPPDTDATAGTARRPAVAEVVRRPVASTQDGATASPGDPVALVRGRRRPPTPRPTLADLADVPGVTAPVVDGRRPPQLAAWRRFAVTVPPLPESRPAIAVVIDDLGLDRRNARRVIGLPGPLTLAFMTYAGGLADMTRAARAAGHELMLHVPMEPEDAVAHDPGPVVLRTGLPRRELRRRLGWGLARFSGYAGVNNHMGSRFTASRADMRPVMAELKRRGLLFLDSLTTDDSVGIALAREFGIPYAERDVFLDHEPRLGAVRGQLARLEAAARERGFAVGIGHPRDDTIEALAQWLPTLAARGFRLVPVSAVVHRPQLGTTVHARRSDGSELR